MKSRLSNLFSGAFIQIAGVGFELVISFLSKITIARLASPEQYGKIVLMEVLVVFVTIFCTLGMDIGLGRFLPRKTEKKFKKQTFLSAALVTVPLSIILLIFLLVFSRSISIIIFDSPTFAVFIKIFSISVPLYLLIRLSVGVVQGSKRSIGTVLIRNISLPGSRLLVILAAAMLSGGVILYAKAYLISYFITSLIGAYYINKLIGLKFSGFHLSISNLVELSRFSLPLVVSAGFQQITSRADLLMIGYFMTSSAIIGQYDAAVSMSQLLLAFISSFGYITMPILSEMHSNGKNEKMVRVYLITTKWILILTTPFALGFLFFPKAIISISFGPSYSAGSLPLQILSVGFLIHTFVGPSGSALNAIGKSRAVAFVSGSGAIVNLCFNLYLIPRYSIIGASVSTLFSYLVMNSVSTYILLTYDMNIINDKRVKNLLYCLLPFIFLYFAVQNLIVRKELIELVTVVTIYVPVYISIIVKIFITDEEKEIAMIILQKYNIYSDIIDYLN